MPITFSAQDVNLASFPHTDAMGVTVHVDRWDVTKILIDNESQAKILFLIAFEKLATTERTDKAPLWFWPKKNQTSWGHHPTHIIRYLIEPSHGVHHF
jgi:hypothetical protein